MATIKVVERLEEFATLKDFWDGIVAKNDSAHAFQSFDWNYLNWTEYHLKRNSGDELFILIASRDGHDECGIFPFCINKKGVLKFISAVYADYLDVITRSHEGEVWHALFSDVAKFINECPKVKSVQLDKLPAESELLSYMGAYLPNVRIERQIGYSFLEVKKAVDIKEVFPHLGSKDRSYLKSLLKKNPYMYRCYSSRIGLPYPKDRLVALRDRMLALGRRKKESVPDLMLDFVEKIYNKGLCDLAVLEDATGVFHLASCRLTQGERISFWLVLYLEHNLPTLADACYILDVVSEKSAVFDWGIGVYSYKLGTFRPRVSNLFRLQSIDWGLGGYLEQIKSITKNYLKRSSFLRLLLWR